MPDHKPMLEEEGGAKSEDPPPEHSVDPNGLFTTL